MRGEPCVICSGSEFIDQLHLARTDDTVIIGAVSVQDITEALQSKNVESREEIKISLPVEIRNFTDLFLDDKAGKDDTLPPHRPGIDTRVPLQKDSQG